MFVATRAEINDLDAASSKLLEKDVLRLEVAVDDAVSVEVLEA